MQILEMKAKQSLTFKHEGKDHRIEFPFHAVAAIEEEIGRKMTTLPDWFKIQTKEIPAILRHGLVGLEKEEAQKAVEYLCGGQGPEGIESMIDDLCATAFPDQVKRYKEELEKYRQGKPLPNVQSGAAS